MIEPITALIVAICAAVTAVGGGIALVVKLGRLLERFQGMDRRVRELEGSGPLPDMRPQVAKVEERLGRARGELEELISSLERDRRTGDSTLHGRCDELDRLISSVKSECALLQQQVNTLADGLAERMRQLEKTENDMTNSSIAQTRLDERLSRALSDIAATMERLSNLEQVAAAMRARLDHLDPPPNGYGRTPSEVP